MNSINFVFTAMKPLKGVLDGYMNDIKLQVTATRKIRWSSNI